MNDLYEKIYQLLIKNISKENILFELNNTIKYIQSTYFEYFNINYDILYFIKDIIWYNLEFLPNNQPLGLNNFDTLGSKFNIISQLDNNIILNYNNINKLIDELQIIINEWNNNWKVVKIFSDVNNKSSNEVIIYNKGESPRKYNYYKKSNIVDVNDNNIFINKNVMLCEVNSIIGEFHLKNIIYNKINDLLLLCKQCKDKKFLIIKCDNY